MRLLIPAVTTLLTLTQFGCEQRKSYMRDPLVRHLNLNAGPNAEPENATRVDPYPPVAPVLPDEAGSPFAAPLVRSAELSPVTINSDRR